MSGSGTMRAWGENVTEEKEPQKRQAEDEDDEVGRGRGARKRSRSRSGRWSRGRELPPGESAKRSGDRNGFENFGSRRNEKGQGKGWRSNGWDAWSWGSSGGWQRGGGGGATGRGGGGSGGGKGGGGGWAASTGGGR
eukprot:CAMPEP_0170392634 /NCGR_PEP_ID=MMETSP0117_2-20130122/20295_1 /TAXON_ID=400756 /ORGANISM="Durinskia baltica, Strain CSIRO CS-38" /LENGTH=136 /DNA_ID=CAMNT_0010648781 /DNA_START=59 /DNA_END=466 /DNA_ORIENTATION=+